MPFWKRKRKKKEKKKESAGEEFHRDWNPGPDACIIPTG